MDQEASIFVPLIAVLIVIVLVSALALVIFAPPAIFPNTAPNVTFHSETMGYEDHLVFSYYPGFTTASDYWIEFEATENGRAINGSAGMIVSGISDTNPLTFGYSRSANTTYSLAIEIRNPGEDVLLYESVITVGNVPG
jgi:hypothetical protein